jgi:hypothetical protein
VAEPAESVSESGEEEQEELEANLSEDSTEAEAFKLQP